MVAPVIAFFLGKGLYNIGQVNEYTNGRPDDLNLTNKVIDDGVRFFGGVSQSGDHLGRGNFDAKTDLIKKNSDRISRTK